MFNFIKIINMKIKPSYKLILETFEEICIYFFHMYTFCVINVIDKSQNPSKWYLQGENESSKHSSMWQTDAILYAYITRKF